MHDNPHVMAEVEAIKRRLRRLRPHLEPIGSCKIGVLLIDMDELNELALPGVPEIEPDTCERGVYHER
ncbi:hypothetical protein [Maridesulfovibrio sp.]|uniref:hypothetical protein n=1 Tax=Maridesulfovibrio sp. TaxID=2795000 RepID=UPI0029CA1F29|nr:hypothetical protein [Maridesulfovibrio sp.]